MSISHNPTCSVDRKMRLLDNMRSRIPNKWSDTELQYFTISVLACIQANIVGYDLIEHLGNSWGKASEV